MYKTSLSAAILAASVCLPVQAQTSSTHSSSTHSSSSHLGSTQSDPSGVNTGAELETLTVVASRTVTPQRQLGSSVSSLDETDLKALGGRSLADALRSMPSVSVTNTGGMGKATSLRVRGEAGYRTLVRVDGVDISDPTGTQASSQVHHLLSTNVARVELLRGPQGMMYGADAGGVLDVTTDRADDGLSGGINLESGRYDTRTYSGHVGGANEQGDFYLSGARASTDGFNAHIEDELSDRDGYENTTVHARGNWNLSESLSAQAVLRDTEAESRFDRCGFPYIDACIGQFTQSNARFSLSQKHDRGSNILAYSQTEVARTNYAGGVTSYDTEGEIAKWELNGDVELSTAHSLVYGLEHRSDQVLELERDQQGLYLEYQGEYDERLYVTAGVRQDENDDFGSNTSYRASAAYLVPEVGSGTLKVRSSVGTGFRAPSLFEIDYNRQSENPDVATLSQEDSFGYELGVEYYSDGGLRLEAVWFDQRIENEIYFDPATSAYGQGNAESESQGVELIAELPLSDQLAINTNYTYVDAISADGSPRSRQPEHLANVGLRYVPMEPLSLSLNWRTSRDFAESELDDYQIVDASARYQVTKGLVAYIRAENLLDEDYVEVPGYNTSGAAGYVGVELTL